MQVFLVTSIYSLLVSLFAGFLVYKHAHISVTLAVKFFTFIGWFLGFSIIAFLPLDILLVRTCILTTTFRLKMEKACLLRKKRSKLRKPLL
jgi:hypothetical protein